MLLEQAIANMDDGNQQFIVDHPEWFFAINAQGQIGEWSPQAERVMEGRTALVAHNEEPWMVVSGDRAGKEITLRRQYR
jgi:hypothetical protein